MRMGRAMRALKFCSSFAWVWILLFATAGMAQSGSPISTTEIEDTIYRADGTPANGDLMVSWQAFSVGGHAVSAGMKSIAINADGTVDFSLAPNAGATPNGSYYTVLYHLSDGTVSTEYWVVPTKTPTGIAAIRSQIAPATVAVASQSFVNSAIVAVVSGYLPLTGGTLTGPLYLSEDPVQSSEAATKHYVDEQTSVGSGGLSSKLSLAPASTQTVLQPGTTSLTVNNLENVEYAAQYQTGAGANGINNAENQPQCLTSGCLVTADPGYSLGDKPHGVYFTGSSCTVGGFTAFDFNYCGLPWPQNARLWDQRGGVDHFVYANPFSPADIASYPPSDSRTHYTSIARKYVYDFDQDFGASNISPESHAVTQFAGGHNQNGNAVPGSSGFKTNFFASIYDAFYFSRGQHMGLVNLVRCTGLGDCLMAPQQEYTNSGVSAASDEGNHWGDEFISEDPHVFHGTLASTPAPSAGSQALFVSAANGSNGNQGEGRYLLDLTKASCGNEAGAALSDTTNWLCSGNHIVGGAGIEYGLGSGLYLSGGTISGAAGQTCTLSGFGGAFSGATATVALTGTNTIAPNTPIVITNPGITTNNNPPGSPTAALGNGTASCSGTAGLSVSSIYYFTATLTAPAGSFPPSTASTFLTQNVVNPAGSWAPGQQIVTVASSSGFSPGIACIADNAYFEQAPVTAVNSGQLTITFEYPHVAGAFVSQGGGCGYTLAQNADVVQANTRGNTDTVRQAWPLVNTSADGTTATYWLAPGGAAKSNSPYLATPAYNTDWGYKQVTGATASYNAGTGLVTVTCSSCGFNQNFSAQAGYESQGGYGSVSFPNLDGLSLTLSDASYSDAAYNQVATVNVTSNTTFTYTPSATPADTSVSGLTLTYCNCAYTLYPYAEVAGVYNTATKEVDGTIALAANGAPWSAGDQVEQPHWHQMNLENGHDVVQFYEPIEQEWGYHGPSYAGRVTGTLDGYVIHNLANMSNYLGYGGTDSAPLRALSMQGWWHTGLDMYSAPEESVISVGCKPLLIVNGVTQGGCGSWNSGFHVGKFTSNVHSYGLLDFLPQTGNFVFTDAAGGYGVAIGNQAVTNTATCTATAPCTGEQITGAGATLSTVNANVSGTATIASLTVTGSCSGCASVPPAGTSGQVQVNGSSALTAYSGLTETSSAVNIGGAGYTTTVTGTANINASASSGQTNIGNSSNYTQITGSAINFFGGSQFNGNPQVNPVGTANATTPFYNSYYMQYRSSTFSGGSVCTNIVSLGLTMTSVSQGYFGFGPSNAACGGTTPVLGANLATGIFAYSKMPAHETTANVSGTTSLSAGANVTANWTSGTTQTDADGSMTLVTSGAISAGTTLVTVNFGTLWPSAPNCVFSPGNAASISQAYLPAAGSSSFALNAGGSIAAGTTLVYSYVCHS